MERNLRFAPPKVEVQKRADGSMLLRSPQKLGPYARCVTEWLVQWSDRAPDRVSSPNAANDGVAKADLPRTYGAVRRIAQALLDRGLGPGAPGRDPLQHRPRAARARRDARRHPGGAVSPAYSLMSKDFGKLKYIFDLVRPGLVYAADPQKFALALAAVGATSTPVAELLETNPGSTQGGSIREGQGPTRSPRSCSPRARPGSPRA